MSFELDNVKMFVQEHPSEIIAGVALVGVLGAVCYAKSSNKRDLKEQRAHEIKLAKLHAKSMRPPWWTMFVRSRRTEYPALKLVA